MPARSILMAIALSAWLVISILVFVTVAYVGFIGVGVVGLLMWFICTLVELDATVSVNETGAFFALTVIGIGGFLLFQI